MKYLNSREYYEDSYDRSTVTKCRWIENFHKNYKAPKKITDKATKKEIEGIENIALHYDLLFNTGERYLKREETIEEWIERDTEKENRYNNTKPPEDIFCLSCSSRMSSTFKTFFGSDDKRILFMYNCPNKCMPRRSFFDNGDEWEHKPIVCIGCGSEEITREDKSTEEKFLIIETCKGCGKVTEDEYVWTHKEEEKEDLDYEKDKARFCLNAEKAQEYIDAKRWFKDLESLMNDIEDRDKNKEVYQAVVDLEKLTVVQLEKRIKEVLEKEGYINLMLEKPVIDRDVKVEFSVQDSKEGRDEYASRNAIKKALKTSLESTNWRLMSDGVSYRLGVLTARLRGYESESDLLKLVQKKSKN